MLSISPYKRGGNSVREVTSPNHTAAACNTLFISIIIINSRAEAEPTCCAPQASALSTTYIVVSSLLSFLKVIVILS